MIDINKFLHQEGLSPFTNSDIFWKWAEKRAGRSQIIQFQDLLHQRTTGEGKDFDEFYDRISNVNLSIIAASFEYGLLKCILEWVEPRLPENGTIIELGCHSGILTRYYALVRPKVNVIGIDISAKAIQTAQEIAARRKTKNLSFVQCDLLSMDITCLPKADCVISGRVLGELMDRKFRYMTSFDPGSFPPIEDSLDLKTQKAIGKCKGLLSKSGKLLVVERLANFDRLNRLWQMIQKTGFIIDPSRLTPIQWTDVAGNHSTWFFESNTSTDEHPTNLQLTIDEVPVLSKSRELNENETRLFFNGRLAYETWKSVEKTSSKSYALVELSQGGKEYIETDFESSPGYVFIANNLGEYSLTLFLKSEKGNVEKDMEEYLQQLIKDGANIKKS